MTSSLRRKASAPAGETPPRTGATRVLVVDGDAELRSALTAMLSREGYSAEAVGSAAAALRVARCGEFSLVIFDLLLPDGDGRLLLDELLAIRPAPLVMVLTRVSNAVTRATCLEKGACDYLTKPFAPRELLARVRLRLELLKIRADRHGADRHGDDGKSLVRLDIGRLTADAGRGPVQLTRMEFLLLKTLAECAGRPVSSRQLLAEVWGYAFETRSNVVSVCVKRLRAKLGSSTIETVRRQGYRLIRGNEPAHLSPAADQAG